MRFDISTMTVGFTSANRLIPNVLVLDFSCKKDDLFTIQFLDQLEAVLEQEDVRILNQSSGPADVLSWTLVNDVKTQHRPLDELGLKFAIREAILRANILVSDTPWNHGKMIVTAENGDKSYYTINLGA